MQLVDVSLLSSAVVTDTQTAALMLHSSVSPPAESLHFTVYLRWDSRTTDSKAGFVLDLV